MPLDALRSLPHVCEVAVVRGADAAPDAVPDLLVEMPHSATRAAHFDALAAELHGPFPDRLKDFFFVNTDVGSGELGQRVAELAVAADPRRTALTVRCLIPRTFVDCNRLVDAAADATAGVTPGLPPYVRDPRDRDLLLGRHVAYAQLVQTAVDRVCGAGGGLAMMVHTYGPRTVAVQVDDDIVRSLHAAYEPEVLPTWPLRHEVDLITRDGDDRLLADPRLLAHVRTGLAGLGITPGENATYHLHPATTAAVHAAHHPGRTLCLEVRRDLLVREFTPFAEMEVLPERVEPIAATLAAALVARWAEAAHAA